MNPILTWVLWTRRRVVTVAASGILIVVGLGAATLSAPSPTPAKPASSPRSTAPASGIPLAPASGIPLDEDTASPAGDAVWLPGSTK